MKKILKVVGISLSLVIIWGLIFAIFLAIDLTNSHDIYNERHIVGHTEEEIVDRYGEFYERDNYIESDQVRRGAYITDSESSVILGRLDKLYVSIRFDENGIAESVSKRPFEGEHP